ncbi:hypothetical protein P2H44_14865 [Albimonas sp. CAU 1670]|uniref:hypothetical protein n=1 Tax=Albimonas sp. CAU 1670 TaxID=3032599 RepID=UPI0023DB526E|nr:hypothetical protein [Albimonas sp. CAU 1670]MDF2233840.1 hypothetical protein [Albimonas sp. CAU 1670]
MHRRRPIRAAFPRRLAALLTLAAAAGAPLAAAQAAAWSRAADQGFAAAQPSSEALALAAALCDGGLTAKVLSKTEPLVASSLSRIEEVGPEISDEARPLLAELVRDQLRGRLRGQLIPALADVYLDSFSPGELDAMMQQRLAPGARGEQPDHTSFLRRVNGRLSEVSITALGESFAAGRDLIASGAELPLGEGDRQAAIELLDMLAQLTERHVAAMR